MAKIVLKNVRISFPDLFEAKAVNGGSPAYGASFIFPKDHPQVAEINAAITEVAKAKWADKADVTLKALKAQDRIALHDGDTKAHAGYAGNYFISARNQNRPAVFDNVADPNTGKARVLNGDEGKPYSGSYVNAVLDIWAQSGQYGNRVNASLVSVQFWKDGESFGSGPQADAGDFETLGVGAEADDFGL